MCTVDRKTKKCYSVFLSIYLNIQWFVRYVPIKKKDYFDIFRRFHSFYIKLQPLKKYFWIWPSLFLCESYWTNWTVIQQILFHVFSWKNKSWWNIQSNSIHATNYWQMLFSFCTTLKPTCFFPFVAKTFEFLLATVDNQLSSKLNILVGSNLTSFKTGSRRLKYLHFGTRCRSRFRRS